MLSSDSVAQTAQPTPASAVERAAAFLAGLLVMAVSAIVTLGTALVGLAGMGIVTWALRRRGRPLSRGGGWIAACCAVAIVLVAASGTIWSVMPQRVWRDARRAMDSASAAPEPPPPAWLDRIAPGTSRRAAAMGKPPAGFQTGMMLWGFGFMIVMMSSLAGSLGWAMGMLFGFAVKGHWPGAGQAA
jgi:hypothetical protein